MNSKWLAVAGGLLDRAAGALSNRGCNDWRWPANWSPEERQRLAEAMVADNLRKSVDQLTDAEIDEACTHATGEFGPPDWWVARFLARKLIEESQ